MQYHVRSMYIGNISAPKVPGKEHQLPSEAAFIEAACGRREKSLSVAKSIPPHAASR
ncbi:hypothetical protein ASZ90_010468 [hydrocarbon metagenome]|uniref:Uncharacterized protein n=1 Tax=hydrocarbon metagenome TaxID=938273 RepID=A0A0W8FFX8_9ZZZZ